MSVRRIPLSRPEFSEDEERRIVAVLRSGWVTQGPVVAELERCFAAAVGAREGVAVTSGTTALFLALVAGGVGPGDEVIVPSLTYIASVNAIVHSGATPVLVDVDPKTYNLDPAEVERALTPLTKAVMPIHQLGLPADIDALDAIVGPRGVAVVVDAACAAGSRWRGRPVGVSPHANAWSFHPRKVLVTGEGGMITLDDPEQAVHLRRLRHQGMSISDTERDRADRVITERYDEVGYNLRMSDLHAAVGLAQLDRLEEFVARRRQLAARYDRAFAEPDFIVTPFVPEGAEPNYQSYIVRLADHSREQRDAFMDGLLRRGVASRRGLMAVHRETPYRNARRVGSLPHSEAADAQTVVLPIFPALSDDDQAYVIEQVFATHAELA